MKQSFFEGRRFGLLRQTALMVVITTVLLSSFQNCSATKIEDSNPASSGSLDRTSLLRYFHYDYTATPVLYANLALIFPQENIGNFAQFTILGTLTPADGSTGPISYEVNITDSQGATICAGNAGVLNADEQSFSFNCLGSPSLTKATVQLSAIYNGKQELFSADFSK